MRNKGEASTIITIAAIALFVFSTLAVSRFVKFNQIGRLRAQTPVCGDTSGSCTANGEWCIACTGNRGPCSDDAGVGLPYQCNGQNWLLKNPSGECNASCSVLNVPLPTTQPVVNPTRDQCATGWYCYDECASQEVVDSFSGTFGGLGPGRLHWLEEKISNSRKDNNNPALSCDDRPYGTGDVPTVVPPQVTPLVVPTALPTAIIRQETNCTWGGVSYPSGYCSPLADGSYVYCDYVISDGVPSPGWVADPFRAHCQSGRIQCIGNGFPRKTYPCCSETENADGTCTARPIGGQSFPTPTQVVFPTPLPTLFIPPPTSRPLPTPPPTSAPTRVPTATQARASTNCRAYGSDTPYPPGYCSPLANGTYVYCARVMRGGVEQAEWVSDSSNSFCPAGSVQCIANTFPRNNGNCCSGRDAAGICTRREIALLVPSPTAVGGYVSPPTATPGTITTLPTLAVLPTSTLAPTWAPAPTIPAYVPPTQPPSIPTSLPVASSCSEAGLGLYQPQPRRLGRELCEDSTIVRLFTPDEVPPNLVNVRQRLGPKYLMADNANLNENGVILAQDAVINDIKGLLDGMTARYKANPGSSCIPFLAYVYRSYAFQQRLYDAKRCIFDPSTGFSVIKDKNGNIPGDPGQRVRCGVGRPEFNTHQSGTAIDLYCARLACVGNNCFMDVDFSRRPIDVLGKQIMEQYGFTPAMSWDPPHFEYIF